MLETARIIVADDHPLFRTALKESVSQIFQSVQFIDADSFDSLRVAAEANSDADMVLLDLDMPGAHGLSALVFLSGQHPGLPVVVVSASSDPATMRRAVDYGASGFIPKSTSTSQIRAAIEAVFGGDVWLPAEALDDSVRRDADDIDFAARVASLTPQQFRVLMMLTEGLLNKQIAGELDVSEATVKAHVSAIFRKLGVRSRTQAAVAARRLEIEAESGDVSNAG